MKAGDQMKDKRKKKSAGAHSIATVNILLIIFILITLIIIANVSIMISGNLHTDMVINITQTAPDRPTYAPPQQETEPETPDTPPETESEEQGVVGEPADEANANIDIGEAATHTKDETEEEDNNPIAGDAMRVFDKDKTWSTTTDINIFEHNDPRVKSDGTGDSAHVIAPGTSNTYTFTLENNKQFPIEYKLTVEGANDSRFWIPVWVDVKSPTGKSISGGTVKLADLGKIGEYNTLKPGESKLYTIWWEWPFERGEDEYDTSLGDKAVEEEIACHMTINVIAEYDISAESSEDPDHPSYEYSGDGGDGSGGGETPDDPNKPDKPKPVLTGDSIIPVMMFGGLGTAALVLMIVLIVTGRKKKKDEDS